MLEDADFVGFKVKCNGIELIPFQNWSRTARNGVNLSNDVYEDWRHKKYDYILPGWWSNYQILKHSRYDIHEDPETQEQIPNNHYANLENTLNALAGLYIVERYIYKKLTMSEQSPVNIPLERSVLFNYDNIVTGQYYSSDGIVC